MPRRPIGGKIQFCGRSNYDQGMIAQFALLLIFGMSLMWALMPRSQVTVGFFRIQLLISLGLSVLALLTLGRLTAAADQSAANDWLTIARVATGLIIASSYVGSVLWTLGNRPAGTVCQQIVLIASFFALAVSRGGLAWIGSASGLLLLFSDFATAAVLGGAMTGMLLGHWYLTAPTMSIDPLRKLSLYFGAAVCLRLVASSAGWFHASHVLHDSTHWTWFALRWLAGIIAPAIISVMAVKILKYRNTQATTGVLFAGVILTFIGEMSAALLYSELHVPL